MGSTLDEPRKWKRSKVRMPEGGNQDNYIRRIRCGIDNCYIVRQGDSAIMVDTGRPRYRQRVVEAAREEDICLIVLTHGHCEHVGNAVAVADDMDVPIAMHAGDVDLIKDNHLQRMHATSVHGYIELFWIHMLRPRKVTDTFVPDIYLMDGMSLSDFGVDAKVVGLPGHTIGSIGLDVWGTDLIAGDAVMTHPSPSTAAVYGNRLVMEESCDKIFRLGKRKVWCGHGEPTENCNWTGAVQPLESRYGHVG